MMPIADHNGQPADGVTGLSPGYVFSPFRSRHSVLFPTEPSAVDQLAALSDQDGEAAERVKAWKKAREEQAERRKKWKVYKDPTFTPVFVGRATVDNL